MTTKTSRRAILAGAATLPALAMPAIAAAPIGKISFPDLATEFADLYPRWLAGMKKGAEDLAAFNAKVKAATGILRDAQPPYDNDPTGYWNTLNALANKPDGDRDPVDKDGRSIVWAEIHDELFALAEEIMRQPAKSIADLALQAQVAGVINEQHWNEGLEFEPDNVCLRVLADNICKIAGVEILAGLEKQYGPEDIERVRHADYVEAISKHSGGKVEWFECPHCAIIFDAFGNAQLALDTCVAHAKTCERRA